MSKEIEPPLTRTQFSFRNVDWDKTLREYSKYKDDDARIIFLIEKLKGLGSTAYAVKQMFRDGDVDAIKKEIARRFNDPRNIDKSGQECKLNGTPSTFTPRLDMTFWANHPVLSVRKVLETRQIRAHGGGTFLYVIMPQPTRGGGYQGLHVEAVFVFDHEDDGEPLTLSVGLRYPDGLLAGQYVLDRYNLASLGVTAEPSDYSKLMTPSEGDISPGSKNIALFLRKKDWHLAIVDKLDYQKQGLATVDANAPYGEYNAFPVMAFSQHKCDINAASLWLQLEALHKAAVGDEDGDGKGKAAATAGNTPLSLATHSAPNSCGATGARLHAEASGGLAFGLEEPQETPLRDLVCKAFEKADKICWAKEGKSPHLKDVTPDVSDQSFDIIPVEEALSRLQKILGDPEMSKNTIEGHPGWNNSYNTFLSPHPNKTAAFLEQEAVRLLVVAVKKIPDTNTS